MKHAATEPRQELESAERSTPPNENTPIDPVVNYLLSLTWWHGGRYRARTDDFYGVNVALCQLS